MPKRALQDKAVSIEYVPLSELQRTPRNPKRHDEAAIESSISRFGYVQPIVIDERTGRIVAGHGRLDALQAMKAAGKEPPPRIEVDGDEWKVPVLRGVGFKNQHEAEAFLLADNQLTTLGGWDNDALAEMLAELQAAEVPVIGWGESEIRELLAAHGPGNELHGDLDDAPEPPAKSFVRMGDLWTLGDHRILCGDCTKPEDVERAMGGERAALLVTDPPYGVSYADKNRFLNAVWPANRVEEPIEADHQTPEEMTAFWKASLTACREALADGASYYVTGPQGGDLLLLLLQTLSQTGYPLRHMLIWAKNQFVIGRSDYHYQHEPIIFGWVKGSHKFYGDRGESSLWQVAKPHQSKLHPTMKPVELFARAVKNSSRNGDIVLDPFSGSGTTLIACEQLSRRCRAIEISPNYVEVSLRRWEQATGKTATLDGKPSTQVEAERKCAA